ncbi:small multidrug efflux protein [Pseudactinotalea sp. HY160]|uniref:small multidrug efflux protein n=1 Tax=Pseudactinotalea sp. HY160 TaxID=2654490 RepID=UPI00128C3353|nr:small multidrug efflux protein [Pseudactinotalea sp. HY160]MPV50228.1 small multidrug efflux protein [Pseudactinotalea sp. HY160]
MDLIAFFQDLVAQVPELLQPVIVSAAAAIPFIEGEGAATIGIVGGIPPVLAALAAIAGNLLCVTVLVLTTTRVRRAVITRHHTRVLAGAGGMDTTDATDPTGTAGTGLGGVVDPAAPVETGRKAARRAKFQRALERYGVPGVSLLGPLLIPTQFTATMLAAAGVRRQRILLWQGIAITGWTTLVTVLVVGALSALA